MPGLVGFARALRDAGVGCGPERVQAYLRAVAEFDAAEPSQLYWAGRLTLCAEPDDLPRYDAGFAAWFGLATSRPSPSAPQQRQPPPRIAALTPLESGDGEGAEQPPLRAAASDVEVLRHRDIGELSPAERAHLRELIALLRPDPPRRSALRLRPARRGELDPRRTLRALLAAGGEPARLRRRHKARRPRRVVLLVDVSGSMSPYADALLRFAHVVTRAAPASTETFTLGTRMTRLTRQLRQRDPEHALTAAARAVPDFAGGTRLGEGIKAFLDRWGQRGAARQAVVVVFSDGWERGDPSLLGEQMARLRRLAHAVLWVNPHAGRDGYVPVQSGIRVALPHVDGLLAGHSVQTLQELLSEVRRA
ncbi:VWA domain-containing protein [Gandjariella thermophila]|uniref:VWA domain-containing protein n=1 Tax=Gandjariella thermophila TaxID=1931992 RepID=A0A4D4J8M5_9PSEU|nr:VWA domain-containing protein [Gandjariella thermophila]